MLFDSVVRSESPVGVPPAGTRTFDQSDLLISSRHLLSREHLTSGPSKTTAAFFVRFELLELSYILEEKR